MLTVSFDMQLLCTTVTMEMRQDSSNDVARLFFLQNLLPKEEEEVTVSHASAQRAISIHVIKMAQVSQSK